MTQPFLHGVSRQSLTTARERLDAIGTRADVDAGELGQELFEIVHLMDREHGVRRMLADPATEGERKQDLVAALLRGRVSDAAAEVLGEVVTLRWSSPRAMLDATEVLAVDCEVTAASQTGRVDEVEDELFRFGRIVAGQPELRSALTDRTLPDERKRGLVSQLLADRAAPSTVRLATEAATNPRRRSFADVLSYYGGIVAERQRRLVASVRAAVPLTEEERERLRAALRAQYEQDVHLNIEVDPNVVGGVSVYVGADLIDGTISRRIDEARRRLAS